MYNDNCWQLMFPDSSCWELRPTQMVLMLFSFLLFFLNFCWSTHKWGQHLTDVTLGMKVRDGSCEKPFRMCSAELLETLGQMRLMWHWFPGAGRDVSHRVPVAFINVRGWQHCKLHWTQQWTRSGVNYRKTTEPEHTHTHLSIYNPHKCS